MSRFAQRQRVFFIEEPEFDQSSPPRWESSQRTPNLSIHRLHTPIPTPGFHDDHLPLLVALIYQLLADEKVDTYAVWLYTPMALPVAESLNPRLLIYDCMDELSAFLYAPPALLEREAALLQQADLVFTGGPSLYRAKRDRHPSVHCFPSSVDADHFRQGQRGTGEREAWVDLPHPHLGFYGVIDERVDLEILDTLARERPDWQIIMVGPVAKIDPNDLPQPPNLHYLGQRSYQDLPHYLADWDVCLLPFARNEATRFISPTKTLEYMAAERPIVSTPITDVAEPYGDIVYLGDTPERFVAACDRALAASDSERQERIAKMRTVLAGTSWANTVQAMQGLIDQALVQRSRTLTKSPSE